VTRQDNPDSSEFPDKAWRKGDWGKLREAVEQGWEFFWSKDEIRGFDPSGKRIGTGIPRVKPKRHGYLAFGSKKVSSDLSK